MLEQCIVSSRTLPVPTPGHGDELVSRQALAELTGIRPSTIAYYADLGLLPYVQAGPRLARRFHTKQAAERLRLIASLRAEGLNIEAIIEHLNRHGSANGHKAIA